VPIGSGWWFGTCFIFHFIYGMILPIDELIFFKIVIAPPTRIFFSMKNLRESYTLWQTNIAKGHQHFESGWWLGR